MNPKKRIRISIKPGKPHPQPLSEGEGWGEVEMVGTETYVSISQLIVFLMRNLG
jgi:hypothetical protein